jgi:hypothetical protein
MTGPYGQVRVHANLSPRLAQVLGLMTSGTYGRTGTISSASAALQSSLASRLQARTASVGSTLFKLTWKERATPSGRLICALRASVRRTSDNDFGSLQKGGISPQASDGKGSGANQNTASLDKQVKALAGWTTPSATDGERAGTITPNMTGSSLTQQVSLAGWPTPRTSDTNGAGEHGTGGLDLRTTAQLSGWPQRQVQNQNTTPMYLNEAAQIADGHA